MCHDALDIEVVAPGSLESIREAEVHLWRVQLASAAPPSEFAEILSPAELLHASKFAFQRDRIRFIQRRGFLRSILGAYLGTTPALMRFTENAFGKPSLAVGSGQQINFNTTSSDDLALYAVTRGRAIGVDVERIRHVPEAASIAQGYFSRVEFSSFVKFPTGRRDRAFLDCWTRKEAYVKALGAGLSMPLDSFDVCLWPDCSSALLRVRDKDTSKRLWTLRSIRPGRGYVGALAMEGRFNKITHFRIEAKWVGGRWPARGTGVPPTRAGNLASDLRVGAAKYCDARDAVKDTESAEHRY